MRVIKEEFFFGIFLVFMMASALWFLSPDITSGVGDTVTVTATIAADITCSMSTTTITFGTIDENSVHGGDSTDTEFTLSCPNSGGGCILNATSTGDDIDGGLYSTTASKLIPSPNAALDDTAALEVGTEGYGKLATSTFTTGGFGINPRYAQSDLTSNTVGKIATSTLEFASSTGAITSATGTIRHKVAVSGSTPAASDYQEVILYSCTAN